MEFYLIIDIFEDMMIFYYSNILIKIFQFSFFLNNFNLQLIS